MGREWEEESRSLPLVGARDSKEWQGNNRGAGWGWFKKNLELSGTGCIGGTISQPRGRQCGDLGCEEVSSTWRRAIKHRLPWSADRKSKKWFLVWRRGRIQVIQPKGW